MNWDHKFDPPTTYEIDIRDRENSGICEFHDPHDPHMGQAWYQVSLEASYGWGRYRDICDLCLYSEFDTTVDNKKVS